MYLEVKDWVAQCEMPVAYTKYDVTIPEWFGFYIQMIGNEYNEEQVISEFTLALLEDLGFYKANYVVVDSFHALVFSLLFNKEFVVIGNKQRGLDRFKSLLDIVDLSERLIYKASDLTDDMINREINWKNVNNKLEIERKKSRTFLIDALNG